LTSDGKWHLQFSHNFIIVEDMRKREYLGQLELMVLLAVMRPARDAYGVLISREIAEKSGRDVALASVYAALERLERKGFVSSSLGEPTAERGGRARTYFKPTAAGLREAREAHGTLLRLSSGLSGLKGELA
jgi:PadR family transcriptional regulator PadR